MIVVTGNGDQENALTAVARGAYDFYEKPVDTDTLKLLVDRAFNIAELEAENRRLQSQVAESPLDGIVAASESMLAVCRMIEKIAPTDVTTLLLGESGTGKELLARALHRLSPRAEGNFVAINCAAIPENLLESELFGHEKGAFTGAHKQTVGKIEVANGGTLFLDEIGDMPLALQAKMLRFLQERVIERVGGRKEIPVDVRVVCATNQNPEGLIKEGRSFSRARCCRNTPNCKNVRLMGSRTMPLLPSRPIPGPATSANSRTRSRARSSWPTARWLRPWISACRVTAKKGSR